MTVHRAKAMVLQAKMLFPGGIRRTFHFGSVDVHKRLQLSRIHHDGILVFFGLFVVVAAAILHIHVQKHFCYKFDRSDGMVDRYHWYDYDDGYGNGGGGGVVVDGAGGPSWKGSSRATARRVPIAAWIYSLRMSSTKAVSRSSPISLYFSFSMTSSSSSLSTSFCNF